MEMLLANKWLMLAAAVGVLGLGFLVLALALFLWVRRRRRKDSVAVELPGQERSLTERQHEAPDRSRRRPSPPRAEEADGVEQWSASSVLEWLCARSEPPHESLRGLWPMDQKGQAAAWNSSPKSWQLAVSPTAIVMPASDAEGQKWALKIYLNHSSERCAHYKRVRALIAVQEPWLQRRLAAPERDMLILAVSSRKQSGRVDMLITPWAEGELLHHFVARERSTQAGRGRILEVVRKFRVLVVAMRAHGLMYGAYRSRNINVIRKGGRLELKLLNMDGLTAKKKSSATTMASSPTEYALYLRLLAYVADATLTLSGPSENPEHDLSDTVESQAIRIIQAAVVDEQAKATINTMARDLRQMTDSLADPEEFVCLEALEETGQLTRVEARLAASGETMAW